MTPHPTHDQLQLLPADGVPVQLRLDKRTRQIGLAGIANARAILAEQARRRAETRAAEAAAAAPGELGAVARRARHPEAA